MVICIPLFLAEMVFVSVLFSKNIIRTIFDKCASWHASSPLQLVQIDLCGPLYSPSFLGCKHFLTFIDDFSRCTWVYFLKLKSEVFDMFLAHEALVEKQSRHQLTTRRTPSSGGV